jgi:hypothetical protein
MCEGEDATVLEFCDDCYEEMVAENTGRMTMSECRYCGGECETSDEYMCDGYAGDIDNLYGEELDNE